MFPYDFRDERMMKQLKDLSHKVVTVYPELRQDLGGITHNLLNKVRQVTLCQSFCVRMNVIIYLTLSSIYTHFDTLKKKGLENIVEKGEIAQNEQFHLFPQCFLRYMYIKFL